MMLVSIRGNVAGGHRLGADKRSTLVAQGVAGAGGEGVDGHRRHTFKSRSSKGRQHTARAPMSIASRQERPDAREAP